MLILVVDPDSFFLITIFQEVVSKNELFIPFMRSINVLRNHDGVNGWDFSVDRLTQIQDKDRYTCSSGFFSKLSIDEGPLSE